MRSERYEELSIKKKGKEVNKKEPVKKEKRKMGKVCQSPSAAQRKQTSLDFGIDGDHVGVPGRAMVPSHGDAQA